MHVSLDYKTWGSQLYFITLCFKTCVVLANCIQIKEWNEIIIRHNTFTKLPLLYKEKTNLKLNWKLCEREVGDGKVGRKKNKVVLEM